MVQRTRSKGRQRMGLPGCSGMQQWKAGNEPEVRGYLLRDVQRV